MAYLPPVLMNIFPMYEKMSPLNLLLNMLSNGKILKLYIHSNLLP